VPPLAHNQQTRSRKLQKNSSGQIQTKELLSVIKSVLSFVAVALVLRASVVEAFRIPSQSMEPTLEVGDHILVNKLSYGLRNPVCDGLIINFHFCDEALFTFRQPKRQDIVVFKRKDNPSTLDIDESEQNLIKRIIGLPGDKVEVRGTTLYINDQSYADKEHYAIWVGGGTKDFGPVTIPPGKVILLGDNRDQSKDSRYWEDSPFLDIDRIKGRAFIVYLNLASLKRVLTILR
jgi:signal peptidase I